MRGEGGMRGRKEKMEVKNEGKRENEWKKRED